MRTTSEAIKPHTKWTPELRRVLRLHPLAPRSSDWSEIVRLANSGDVDSALELAKSTEKTADIRFRASVARRTRVERVGWLERMNKGDRDLKALFAGFGERVGAYVEKFGNGMQNLSRINDKVHEEIVELRKNLRVWINALVRDSARMAFKNKGQTYQPIFKNSLEVFSPEPIELENILDIVEAKSTMYVKARLASTNPKPKMSSLKWSAAQKKVLKFVLKKNLTGLNPSTRMWDITTAMERTLRRNIAGEVAAGKSSVSIAKKIKKYVSPQKIEAAYAAGEGQGIYASPFKNALRLARTETNRAYVKASVEFAKSKPWITGKEIHTTGSPCAICAPHDGERMSVAEFEDMVDDGDFPFHPNCRCYDVDIIDDSYLEKEEEAA